MIKVFNKYFLLVFVFAIYISPVSAERYPDDTRAVLALENLVKVLTVQRQDLEKLMGMLARLDQWKKNLNQENNRLSQEGELEKADRKKTANGQISKDEFNRKWSQSGRSLKQKKAVKQFKEDVVRFNQFAKDYNELAKKMNHVLAKRSPGKVAALIGDMKKLVQNIRVNLKKGDAIHFSGSKFHGIRNVGDEVSESIWASLSMGF